MIQSYRDHGVRHHCMNAIPAEYRKAPNSNALNARCCLADAKFMLPSQGLAEVEMSHKARFATPCPFMRAGSVGKMKCFLFFSIDLASLQPRTKILIL